MTLLSLTGKSWEVAADFRQEEGDVLSLLTSQRSMQPQERFPLPFSTPDSTPPDLERAIERVQRALRDGEAIAIFGDYDCDGITAATLITRLLRRHGADPLVRLPHRITDGYGLKEPLVQDLADRGISLLITVDTGISASSALALATERGVDVIVIDHHHLPPSLPQAVALLHPGLTRLTDAPPAAAGLALGFVSAFEHAAGNERWDGEDGDAALAAVGTIADLVELRGSNRTMVADGLRAFERLPVSHPLRLLAAQANVPLPLTSRDIAFRLAPRLNAAGRMADPTIALHALLEGGESLLTLERLNTERQSETRRLFADIEAAPTDPSHPLLILASEEYPAGIVGLLAGKLTEAHGKPSIVIQVQEHLCTASLRSIGGYHITEALRACSDLLESFGGHALAAGCTFHPSALPQLRKRLLAHATESLGGRDLRPVLRVDGILPHGAVTLSLCEGLSSLEPFGQGNLEPRFLLPMVTLTSPRRVGKDSSHLQCRLGPLKAIGFQLGSLLERLPPVPLDVACRLSIDRWEGRAQPQVLIEDVRVANLHTLTTERKAVAANTI